MLREPPAAEVPTIVCSYRTGTVYSPVSIRGSMQSIHSVSCLSHRHMYRPDDFFSCNLKIKTNLMQSGSRCLHSTRQNMIIYFTCSLCFFFISVTIPDFIPSTGNFEGQIILGFYGQIQFSFLALIHSQYCQQMSRSPPVFPV